MQWPKCYEEGPEAIIQHLYDDAAERGFPVNGSFYKGANAQQPVRLIAYGNASWPSGCNTGQELQVLQSI